MSLAVRSRWDRTCYNTPRLHANCKPMIDRVVFIRYIEETEPPWDQGNVPWIVRMLVRWGMTILAFIVAKWFVNGVWDGTPIFLHGTDGYLVAPAIFVVVRAIFRPILTPAFASSTDSCSTCRLSTTSSMSVVWPFIRMRSPTFSGAVRSIPATLICAK